MAKLKISTYFPHIFSKFSSNFLQLFQMTKMKCFHHRNKRLREHCQGQSRFLLEWILAVPRMRDFLAARLLRQPTLYLVWQCPWNISYMTSRVCVCQDEFLSHMSLPRCLWDMGIPKHKRRNATTRPVHLNSTGLFMQKQRVRRWIGAIFSCSTKASNSFTQNSRQLDTGRSGKRERNKWLYKIQPLRQQKAIAIWPSASEHGYSIHEAKRHSLDYTLRISLRSTAFQRSLFILLAPCAVLQREGFWHHQGLGKHINTYYDFGGEFHPHLQRIGNTERARLLEVDINFHPHHIGPLFGFSFLIASQRKQSYKAVGGHLQWTSHCFHHKQLW